MDRKRQTENLHGGVGICKETPEELKSSLIFLSLYVSALSGQTCHKAAD